MLSSGKGQKKSQPKMGASSQSEWTQEPQGCGRGPNSHPGYLTPDLPWWPHPTAPAQPPTTSLPGQSPINLTINLDSATSQLLQGGAQPLHNHQPYPYTPGGAQPLHNHQPYPYPPGGTQPLHNHQPYPYPPGGAQPLLDPPPPYSSLAPPSTSACHTGHPHLARHTGSPRETAGNCQPEKSSQGTGSGAKKKKPTSAKAVGQDSSKPPTSTANPQSKGQLAPSQPGPTNKKKNQKKKATGSPGSLSAPPRFNVSLHFAKCFTKAAEVQQIIETRLVEPQNTCQEVSIQSILVNKLREETHCDFIMTCGNVAKAKKLVKSMVFCLKKEADCEISVVMTQCESSRQDKGDGLHLQEASGNSSKKESTAGIDEPSTWKKEDAPIQNTAMKHSSTSGKSKSKKQKSDAPVPSVQTLLLSVGKRFDSPQLFAQFIKLSLCRFPSNVLVVDESISMADSSAECLVKTNSKNDAKRLRKAFQEIQSLTQLKITLNAPPKEGARKKSDDEPSQKTKIETRVTQALARFKEAKDETLKRHIAKVSSTQAKLVTPTKQPSTTQERSETADNSSAWKNRIALLNNQRSEFLDRCNVLSQSLVNPGTGQVEGKDVDSILKDLGLECSRLDRGQPVYGCRKAILKQVKARQVCVVSGGPGSGTGSQLGQYLLEAGYARRGLIACCHHRKSVAVCLAQTVAKEMAGKVGGVVGYKTGAVCKAKDGQTKILYTTDQVLLEECLADPDLGKYSCVVVDDADQRSLYTDLLMAFLKRCLPRRPELRVVVCGSTGDNSAFLQYFNSSQEIKVCDTGFKVGVFHDDDTSENFEDYERKAVSKAVDIHKNGTQGDILVFLATFTEVLRCRNKFEEICQDGKPFKCVALHAHLAPEELNQIFAKDSGGVRRIIFSTECAETWFTVESVKFVVDAGVRQDRTFDARRNLRVSEIRAISKTSAVGRQNLAGRVPDGQCHRLYSTQDFDSLPDRDSPEVLGADLGRVLLMLLEADLDPRSFHFLQAPDERRVECTLQSLSACGAVEGRQVTAVGKALARLPYDLSNNLLILKAKDHNLTFDAAVLATLLFYQGQMDVFYCGLSESMSGDSFPVSSRHGDVIVLFDVYKTWHNLPKEERVSWCHQNKANYKTLGLLRRHVDELLAVMGGHMNVETKTFSGKVGDMTRLRKIVFEAHNGRASHLSGSDGGTGYSNSYSYRLLASQQTMQIHRDSCTALTEFYPEWIVFTHVVLATARECASGTCAVDEDWVREAVESGKVKVDLTELGRHLVFHQEVGPSVFKALVGPCFRHARELDTSIDDVTTGGASCVVEADPGSGTVDVFSQVALTPDTLGQMQARMEQVRERLQVQEFELTLGTHTVPGLSQAKAIFGAGGCVLNLAIPEQSREVIVEKAPRQAKVDQVLARLGSVASQVKSLEKFGKKAGQWGRMTFGSIFDAFAALECVWGDLEYSARLSIGRQTPNVFQAKVSWSTESSAGQRSALVQCPPGCREVLAGRQVALSGRLRRVEVLPGSDADLLIFDVGMATEREVKETLTRQLQEEATSSPPDLTVSIVKHSDPLTDPLLLKRNMEMLTSALEIHARGEDFRVEVPTCWPGHAHFVCFVQFGDWAEGQRVCREIHKVCKIDGQDVEMTPCYAAVIKMPKIIREVCSEGILNLLGTICQTLPEVSIEGRHDMMVIRSSRLESLLEAKTLLSKEMEGQVLDHFPTNIWECFISQRGQSYLESVQRSTDCIVLTDLKTAKIHLYGKQQNVKLAQHKIIFFLKTCEKFQVEHFDLKTVERGEVIMDCLVSEYGYELGRLVEECRLESASLDLVNETIRALGTSAALQQAGRLVSRVQEQGKGHSRTGGKGGSTFCLVCKRGADQVSIHRLETCGHAHCLACLQGIAQTTLKNKSLPLTCSRGACRAELVARDVKLLLSKGLIPEVDLVNAAVRLFVSANQDAFRLCPTVNCPMVYQTSHEPMGSEFVCPLCFVSVCTSCHGPFHTSLACLPTDAGRGAKGPHVQPENLIGKTRDKLVAWLSGK